MKMTGKQIARIVHKYSLEYGGIDNVPVEKWTPIRKDFNDDSQAMHHYYMDEDTFFWNNPLRTKRMKVYNVGKLLRENNPKRVYQVLKHFNMNMSTYNNLLYQYHMCHRGYKYMSPGFKPLYASFRDELVEGITKNEIPGPRTQAVLALVFHNHGRYQPVKNGKVQGLVKKYFIFRKIEYYPNQIALEERRPALVLPYQRVFHEVHLPNRILKQK